MKKIKLILLVVLALTLIQPTQVNASDSYVINRDGDYIFSPDLYTAQRAINYNFEGLNDMFIASDDKIYVALYKDNVGSIVIFDQHEQYLTTIKHDQLKNPTGIFVTSDNLIYVADYGNEQVIVFNSEGQVKNVFKKPTTPLFGADTAFKPQKLVVDAQKNMYIVSEGNSNGLIQLSNKGEFQGFHGSNKVRTTWYKELQRKFLSASLVNQFFAAQPPSITNVAIDNRGIVYTTTQGNAASPIQKLNIAGRNLISETSAKFQDLSLQSVAVDNYENMFILDNKTGYIFILDRVGSIIGVFGEASSIDAPLGITKLPIAVQVNSKQQIYIADQGNNQIIIFEPSDLMGLMYEANNQYNEGRFVESKATWQEIRRYNTSLVLADQGIGQALYKEGNFNEALVMFKQANDRESYSNVFWEVRQVILMEYTAKVLVVLFVISILLKIKNLVRKRTKLLAGYDAYKARILDKKVSKAIRSSLYIFKHPFDTFYNVKYTKDVSMLTASIIYILCIVFYIAGFYQEGFIFNYTNTNLLQVQEEVIKIVAAIVLFIISNYLVASIRDGEGRFEEVYRAFALCLMPYVVLAVPIIILSNVLTLQEIFIYELANSIMLGWMVMLVVIMIIETHRYDFIDALKNLFITIFTAIVIVVILVIIYILGIEFYNFIVSIIKEVLMSV